VSLIVVFFVAYMIIVGGDDKRSEIADRNSAAGERVPSPRGSAREVPVDGDLDTMIPGVPEMPAVPESSAQATAVPEDPATEAPASITAQSPDGESMKASDDELNSDQLAEREMLMPEGGPTPPQAEATQSERSDLAAQGGVAGIQQTDFDSLDESAPPQTNASAGDRRSAVIENRWATAFSNEVPQQDNERAEIAGGGFYNSSPPTGGPAPDANQTVDSPQYPSTNPVSFQYPATYHEHLNGANSREVNRATAWPGQTGVYGQQPSTARMQPRMDAPPIR
jgi:hypothetical protein